MTQAANLQRVSDRIADEVLWFCRSVLIAGGIDGTSTFRMASLTAHVCTFVPGTAPDSPSRILRELRRQGRVDYIVVSRAASLYRVVAVRP